MDAASADGHPLYTNSVDPLSEAGVRALKAWMASAPTAEVNESYIAVLDQLAAEAAQAKSASMAAEPIDLSGPRAGSPNPMTAGGAAGSAQPAAVAGGPGGSGGLAGVGRAFSNYISRVVGAGNERGGGGGSGGAGSTPVEIGPPQPVLTSLPPGSVQPRRSSIRMTNPLTMMFGRGEGGGAGGAAAERPLPALPQSHSPPAGNSHSAAAAAHGPGGGAASVAGFPGAAGGAGAVASSPAAGGVAGAPATASASVLGGPLADPGSAGGVSDGGQRSHGGRRTLSRISAKISPPSSITASASALLDHGYPDVRLSSHVLAFGPGDALRAGEAAGGRAGGGSGKHDKSGGGSGSGSDREGGPVPTIGPLGGRRGSTSSLPGGDHGAGGGSGGGGGGGGPRSASEPRTALGGSAQGVRSQRYVMPRLGGGEERRLAVPPPGSSAAFAAAGGAGLGPGGGVPSGPQGRRRSGLLAGPVSAAPGGEAWEHEGGGVAEGTAPPPTTTATGTGTLTGSGGGAGDGAGERTHEADAPLLPCPLNVPHRQYLAVANFSRLATAHVTVRPLQAIVEEEAAAAASGTAAVGAAGFGVEGSGAPRSLVVGGTPAGAAGSGTPPAGSSPTGAGGASASSAASGVPACFISVEPTSLTLKKGSLGRVAVTITLLRPGARVNALVALEVAGGLRLMVLLRAQAECRVFGIPYSLLPLAAAPEGFPGIPVPLLELRRRLTRGDREGLRTEGIFRVQPPGEEVAAIRAGLDAGTYDGETSPVSALAAAHCIKVFLRELQPAKVFQSVPTEPLLAVNTAAECAALVARHLPPPMQTLLAWLVDTLAETAEYEPFNRMGGKALAVCVSPNLLDTDVSNAAVNPMTALMCSQKAVQVLARLIDVRLAARRQGGAGGVRDSAKVPGSPAGTAAAGLAVSAAAAAGSSRVTSPPAAAGWSGTPLVPGGRALPVPAAPHAGPASASASPSAGTGYAGVRSPHPPLQPHPHKHMSPPAGAAAAAAAAGRSPQPTPAGSLSSSPAAAAAVRGQSAPAAAAAAAGGRPLTAAAAAAGGRPLPFSPTTAPPTPPRGGEAAEDAYAGVFASGSGRGVYAAAAAHTQVQGVAGSAAASAAGQAYARDIDAAPAAGGHAAAPAYPHPHSGPSLHREAKGSAYDAEAEAEEEEKGEGKWASSEEGGEEKGYGGGEGDDRWSADFRGAPAAAVLQPQQQLPRASMQTGSARPLPLPPRSPAE